MDVALWIQTVATVVIAATFVVYILQWLAMRRGSTAQNIISVVQYIQDLDTRRARKHVIVNIGEKSFQAWDEQDRNSAATVCSSYDVVAILVKRELVPIDIIVENWGPSIKLCYPICRPYISEMRNSAGSQYWDDFEWLYNQVIRNFPNRAQPSAAR